MAGNKSIQPGMTSIAKPQPHDTAIGTAAGRRHDTPATVARRRRLLILGGYVETAVKQVGQTIMAGRTIPHAIGTAIGTAAGRRHEAATAFARRRRLLILNGGIGPAPIDI